MKRRVTITNNYYYTSYSVTRAYGRDFTIAVEM